ncbi:hypothetical protein CALVIDRAFT_474998, partial [Calocera viscosa TUFC12733]
YTVILDAAYRGTVQEDHGLQNHQVYLQQDNTPIHKTRFTLHHFELEGIDFLPWPAYSPDMNIIENAGHELDCHNLLPTNVNQLWEALQEEWDGLSISYVQSLYASRPHRLTDLVEAKGSYTKH